MECNHGSHYALGMCINCYNKHLYRTGIAECRNCHQEKKIRAVGQCSACYVYEREYGVPRPERLWNRVSYDYFSEEWHHMTRRVGLPEQAAIYRLSDAFKLSEATITRYVHRYKCEELVAA